MQCYARQGRAQSWLTFCDFVDCSPPGSYLHGIFWFALQEYWNRLPSPPAGDLTNLGIEPTSPALRASFFTTEPTEKPPPLFLISAIWYFPPSFSMGMVNIKIMSSLTKQDRKKKKKLIQPFLLYDVWKEKVNTI